MRVHMACHVVVKARVGESISEHVQKKTTTVEQGKNSRHK